MNKFTTSWLAAAAQILGPETAAPVVLLPGAVMPEAAVTATLMVDIAGEWGGTFTVTADMAALGPALVPADGAGEAAAPRGPEEVFDHWQRLFRRICLDAAADLGGQSGQACEVAMISPEPQPVGAGGMGYQMHAGERVVTLLIADLVEPAAAEPPRVPPPRPDSGRTEAGAGRSVPAPAAPAELPFAAETARGALMKGAELLLDVELEASLRFGSREMALSELLGLGPGDVVQLDRALTDPVDLIVGDKIVARGEVVLVNGNFGLRVTEVAEPRKSLESIRCLF